MNTCPFKIGDRVRIKTDDGTVNLLVEHGISRCVHDEVLNYEFIVSEFNFEEYSSDLYVHFPKNYVNLHVPVEVLELVEEPPPPISFTTTHNPNTTPIY